MQSYSNVIALRVDYNMNFIRIFSYNSETIINTLMEFVGQNSTYLLMYWNLTTMKMSSVFAAREVVSTAAYSAMTTTSARWNTSRPAGPAAPADPAPHASVPFHRTPNVVLNDLIGIFGFLLICL